jgi:hypothetical protein
MYLNHAGGRSIPVPPTPQVPGAARGGHRLGGLAAPQVPPAFRRLGAGAALLAAITVTVLLAGGRRRHPAAGAGLENRERLARNQATPAGVAVLVATAPEFCSGQMSRGSRAAYGRHTA